jgi:hypothetical protein
VNARFALENHQAVRDKILSDHIVLDYKRGYISILHYATDGSRRDESLFNI